MEKFGFPSFKMLFNSKQKQKKSIIPRPLGTGEVECISRDQLRCVKDFFVCLVFERKKEYIIGQQTEIFVFYSKLAQESLVLHVIE